MAMPAYNSAGYIKVAIDSILSQSYKDITLFISDNCSTDGTYEIVMQQAKQDERIVVFRQDKNIGAAANFTFLVSKAESQYFMWASSHDCWSSNYVETLARQLSENHDQVLCYGEAKRIDELGGLIPNVSADRFECLEEKSNQRAAKLVSQLESCHMIYGLMKTEAIKNTRLRLKCIGPDHVILAELSLRGKIAFCPEATLFLRVVRQEPDDEIEFRRNQLIRLLGKTDVCRELDSRYRDWWLQHVISGLNGPGSVFRKVINGVCISSAFAFRWQPLLPRYITLPNRLIRRISG